jgi:poly-beta-1,6-N-acetyl-D-glucosamine biosynthesis protein PgaD
MCGTNLGAHFAGMTLSCTPATLADSALALAGTAASLLLWKRFSTHQARRPQLTHQPDYAGYFGISAQALERGRGTSVCVVHHDEQGRIVRIQARAVPANAATAAPEVPFAMAA